MLPASSSSLLLLIASLLTIIEYSAIFSCPYFSSFLSFNSQRRQYTHFQVRLMSVIMSNWFFYLHFFSLSFSFSAMSSYAMNLYISTQLEWRREKRYWAFEIDILSLIFELDRTDLKIPELVCNAQKEPWRCSSARLYSWFAERMEPFKLLKESAWSFQFAFLL